ncbi:MAG: methyltransferase domain-containing protein [Deltaproteobacteria bacterium]|nr:methyltransferase domain-containing protein [Deltaproteobacteria bacterium]MBW1924318.1 methyltransferase domain-containing protein [Deltaproteobacteria bacterium]MBW1950146.1 methyltransferase domain-containing protein [Deltaproteobacteria bacterium]MBW2008999.1 methyltransferase domain-containing protein [Deltaproteobacteria bacterium]MBW2348561.1 methyltransferase domain-containing protein [Deltaproteobacteria bacterium]
MFSLEEFKKEHETDTSELSIRGKRFRFLLPRFIEPYVDRNDALQDFPLWAKVWEASLVLADYLAGIPADPDTPILEIGCGAGVVGIVASAFGHRVTMMEYDALAVQFATANAHLNLPDENRRPLVLTTDWNVPEVVESPFPLIVGSEVVYSRKNFDPLFRLFEHLLAPGGRIVLCEGMRETSMAFFQEARAYYRVRARKKALRSPGKEIHIVLAEMTLV